MRILLHQDAIVERARLALIRVDAQIDRPRMVLRQKAPLHSRRKTSPAAAAQARVLHQIRHIVRLHRQRFLQRFVAAVGAIAGQRRAIRLVDASQKYRFKLGHERYNSLRELYFRTASIDLSNQHDSSVKSPYDTHHSPACTAHLSHAPRHSANSSVTLPSEVVSPGCHIQPLTKPCQQFFAAAQHARNAAANPHPLLAQRIVGLAEES